MAVTEVTLAKLGATGEASASDPSRVLVKYTASYLAKCDSAEDGPKTVLDHFRNAGDLPWFEKPFDFGNDFDGGSVCRTISPMRIGHSDWHSVDCAFEPVDGGFPGSEADGQGIDLSVTKNPVNWHDEIEISYTQLSAPIYGATFRGFFPGGITNPMLRDGKYGPLVNSAMDPFDPVPEGELDMQILRITRNVFPYDSTIADNYIGTVNRDGVNIIKPAYGFRAYISPTMGKIKNISATFGIVNSIPYYRQTIEVHRNPLGWRLSIIDMGMNRRQMPFGDKKDDGTAISDSDMKDYKPKVTPIRDENNYPILQPILLNGNGQPLELDKNKPPVYLQYEYYSEVDWSAIPW